ncbi:type IV toxin-antitoxin system AbiEi family antitoxin [Cellulophaga lytica]|nr:type IV toxin-antitoxin system AbiEi family antitoxin [Cellulophaga lytica]
MQLSEFIKERLSLEEYSFSTDELYMASEKDKKGLKSDLSYLTKKGDIVPLRKGFYLIIPPRYSKQAKLPIELYSDNLFKSIDRPYYIGLYSAAKFHGASHQQIQRDYIITTTPTLLDIDKGATNLRFFTISKWPKKNITTKKSDAGYFKLSDPILTAVDLIYHQTKLGGINRMLSVLEELIEEIKVSDLKDLLTWYPHKSALQRFGFLLEELQADEKLTSILFEYIDSNKFYPVLLSPKSNQKPGAVDNKWKVDVNIKLESDL